MAKTMTVHPRQCMESQVGRTQSTKECLKGYRGRMLEQNRGRKMLLFQEKLMKRITSEKGLLGWELG